MQTAEAIKEAIISLPEKEFNEIRKWFSEKDWDLWDQEIVHDSNAGSLDYLIDEAYTEKKNGRLRDL